MIFKPIFLYIEERFRVLTYVWNVCSLNSFTISWIVSFIFYFLSDVSLEIFKFENIFTDLCFSLCLFVHCLCRFACIIVSVNNCSIHNVALCQSNWEKLRLYWTTAGRIDHYCAWLWVWRDFRLEISFEGFSTG